MIVKKAQTKEFKGSENCTVYEFPFEDKDINIAYGKIKNQHPLQGKLTNEVCKEILYIISGTGKVIVEDKEYVVAEGDAILILPGQKFYYKDCNELHVIASCTPAWYPEQHKQVD